MMNRTVGVPLVALAAMACLACHGTASAGAMPTAANLTPVCSITVSSNAEEMSYMRDADRATAWVSSEEPGQFVEILPPAGGAAGVYIQWARVPGAWALYASGGGEDWNSLAQSESGGYLNAYVSLSGGDGLLRLEADPGWEMAVAEIRVYGAGTLPADVQAWQPAPEKADLMVVAAHPDDEHLYFGGTLPAYAGQLGKHTVVVYMTSSPTIRKIEALDGLWRVGVREYPVFLPLANEYSSTVEDAAAVWGGIECTVGLLTEQIRTYRPDVVVTHDLDGEYGHGAHRLTALAVQRAADGAGDAAFFADSAGALGVWEVQKCYLHLYPENEIRMDWNVELPAFGGKTAIEMAREGYALHVSQHFRERELADSGPYDNARFGLYRSAVGPDKRGGDFFENVTKPEPTAAPSPSPAPTARPTAQPGEAPASAAVAKTDDTAKKILTLLFVAAVLAGALAVPVKDYRESLKGRHAAKGKWTL